MHHSMIWRSAIREIKGSLGRFLAIFGIVALGVAIFAGLKVVKDDFYKSTTRYFEKTSFYDYHVLGELGFSDEQVELLAAQEDCAAAEGALSFDAYYLFGESTSRSVGRFHSITKDINQLVLVAGRMPEAEGEILADEYYLRNSLNRTIRIVPENEGDEITDFEHTEYRIVGLVKSPLYIQFERGTSALGTGTVDAFFFLPREEFSSKDYTEIYVKLKENFPLYSEEYDAYLEGREDRWKDLLEQAGQMRLEELPRVIRDARDVLTEKSAKGKAELAAAKKKLADANEELTDGEAKLKEGREAISQAKLDLEQAKKDLEDGKAQIEEKEPELEKGRQELEKAKKQIEDNEKLLAEKEAQLTEGKTQAEAAKMTLQLGEMQVQFALEDEIAEQKEIDQAKEDLEKRTKSLGYREQTAKNLGLSGLYAEEFEKERAAIENEQKKLDQRLADLSKRYQETTAQIAQINAGKQELEESLKQIKEGEEAILKGKEALYEGKKALLENQKKLEQGEADLKAGKRKLEDGKRQIEEAERTIPEKEKELEEAGETLKEARAEYEKGFQEYSDGLSEYEEKITDAKGEIQKLKDRLDRGEAPKSYLLGRDTNIGYVCFESDSAIVDGIANVFPVFFFLVAALICVTTMNRMVEEQRTQIGVLKALGYSDGRIMFKFLFYSGSAALTGAIVGYAFGTHFFPWIIWTVYGIIYSAGPIAFVFDQMLACISLVVSILCSVGATYLSCHKELHANASELMRPRAPKAGKRVILEYLPFLWKRLSFLRKVAVRNVLRYKKRFFMMVLGIGGCTGLLLTGFGLKDSIAGVADMQYSEIQHHDISVMLRNEVDDEFLQKLEALKEKGLDRYLVYQETSLDLVGSKGQKSVTVITLGDDLTEAELREFVSLKTKEGEDITKPEAGEAVITDQIADMLGIKAGDKVILRDSDQKELQVQVKAITKNYIFNYVYMTEFTWKEGYGEYSPANVYVKVSEGRSAGEIAPRLMRQGGVASVSKTQDMVKRFGAMMKSMDLIVVVIICCAAGLAFIVLYNLTNINITERIREIATIKVLGFYSGETALYVFRENFLLSVLGAFVGLFMGKWLHAFVMHEIKVEMVSFGVRIFTISYMYSVILTLLFSFLISLMMNRKLEEISMTESLKSVD